jgi:hypothetical protein
LDYSKQKRKWGWVQSSFPLAMVLLHPAQVEDIVAEIGQNQKGLGWIEGALHVSDVQCTCVHHLSVSG